GEYSCTGCPMTNPPAMNLTQMLSGVTSERFSGTIAGAENNGLFTVRGVGNQVIFGTVPTTTTSGSYDVTIPLFCGAQNVTLDWCNSHGNDALVYSVTATACTRPDIRVTLLWDNLGLDWELHLIKPGGRIKDNATDCTWTSCIGRHPDWGVIGDPTDDPSKDVDNTGNYGPENITLTRPEIGRFTVMVEHWGLGQPTSS